MRKLTFDELTAIALIIALNAVSFFIGSYTYTNVNNKKWQRELLDKGYGEYDRKTGIWHLCEPEVVMFNHSTEAFRVLNGGQVTIKDYIEVLETDLKEAKLHMENQRKELADQDILIEKYKKSIKIPGESGKISGESGKKTVKNVEPNVIIPN